MTKFFVTVSGLIFTVTMLYSPATYAEEIWRGAQHGATQAVIIALFPEAVLLEDQPLTIGDKMVASLDGLQIAEIPFRAHFFFAEDGLSRIELRRPGVMKRRQVKKICKQLVAHLQLEHGVPVSVIDRKSMSAHWSGYEFTDGPLRVSLRCTRKKFADHQIKINYRIPLLGRNFNSPHGIHMGMSFKDLRDLLPEEFGEADLGLEDPTNLDVYDVFLRRSPDPADPEGLKIKIRSSNRDGVCGLAAFGSSSWEDIESFFDNNLIFLERITPNNNIYGFFDSWDDDSGPISLLHIPRTTIWMSINRGSIVSQQAWVNTDEDPLPGNVDAIDYTSVIGTNNDGKKVASFKTKYRFSNYPSCGLGNDWEEF